MRYTSAIVIIAVLCPSALWAAASPLTLLTDAEKAYYAQSFDYAMDTLQPGAHHDWASYSGKGTITASESFISKSKYTCRNFSESFTVKGYTGTGTGTGCKRIGNDGWCKLKPGSALTCAMEPPSNIIADKARDMSEFYKNQEVKSTGWWDRVSDWWSR